MASQEKTTSNSGVRWRVVVYAFKSDVPDGNDEDADIIIDDHDIASISIQKNKGACDSPCSILITGDLNDAYRIGNWIVVRSREGRFETKSGKISSGFTPKSSKPYSGLGLGASSGMSSKFGLGATTPTLLPTSITSMSFGQAIDPQLEGFPRFIGQITNVNTSYTKDSSGNLRRVSRITAREWSSILSIPVRYDIGAVQSLLASNNVNVTTNAGAAALSKGNDIQTALEKLSKAAVNPWAYASIVLAFIGALNQNNNSNVIAKFAKLGDTLESAKTFAEVSVKLPTIPKQLLKDIGATGANPKNAFANDSGPGFVAIGIGVQMSRMEKAATEGIDLPNAFDGVFDQSPDEFTQNSYEVTADRPMTVGIGAEFVQGGAAWDLLTTRTDPTITDVFTDIWCYVDGDNLYGRPVLIIRDKPFAVRKYFDIYNSSRPFGSQWTMFDDLPRVQIDDDHITNIQLENTFYNSPNYIIPQWRPGMIRPDSELSQMYITGTTRATNEMSRFGGIQFFPETTFGPIAIKDMKEQAEVLKEWYYDFAAITRLWHCHNYLFLRGTMQIIDDGLPILIGQNITWRMNQNILCAHVENVSIEHSVQGNGRKQTITNITFSHCCLVTDDGSLDYITPQAFNDLYDTKIGAGLSMQFGLTDLASKLPGLSEAKAMYEKAMQIKAQGEKAIRTARDLMTKFF